MAGGVGAAKRLWALDGATITMEAGHLVLGATGSVTMPVPSFLIEHERGLVLFDTGFAPEASVDPEGVFGDYAEQMGLVFTPEQRVDRQIQKLGFKTEDVSHVVQSHTHADHTGGLYLFPQAKFYVGAPDLPYAYWPLPAGKPAFRIPDLEPTRSFDWNLLHGDFDLFADGSITVLAMPGHTPGNASLLVRLADRHVVLTGDTVHLRSALTDELPMGADYNTLDAVASIRRLRQIADSHQADIWIAHDPEDWKDFGAPVCVE